MKVISTRLEEVSRPKNRVLRTGLALLVSAVVLLCLPFVWVAFAFTFAALVDVVPGAYYLWFLGYTLASLVLWTVNRCLRGAVEEIRQSVRES